MLPVDCVAAKSDDLSQTQVCDGSIPAGFEGVDIGPKTIEFWLDRPFRLHDRVVFSRSAKGGWDKTRLYP